MSHESDIYKIIAGIIKEQIEDGTLPNGLILEAAPLARFFGVSRTPVRKALQILVADRLARSGQNRGVVVGKDGAPFRKDLILAGLRLPMKRRQDLSLRNWRSKFYPEIEQEIASCLPFGRFAINVTHLATSKGVSRTIAHETLVRLERLGLIYQVGSKWHAGPMTDSDILDHYEIRWLLEPQALKKSARTLPRGVLIDARERARGWLDVKGDAHIETIDRLERDLHLDIVLHAPTRLMSGLIRRSQLPLMATNFSLQHQRDHVVRQRVIMEHLAVLDALVANDVEKAAAALETHLRSAPNFVREALSSKRSPYMPPEYMVRDD